MFCPTETLYDSLQAQKGPLATSRWITAGTGVQNNNNNKNKNTSIYLCFLEGVNEKQWFADTITVSLRVWTESFFRNSLSDMRNRDEKDAIIEQLYREVNRRVSSGDPETYKSEVVMARLVARKS